MIPFLSVKFFWLLKAEGSYFNTELKHFQICKQVNFKGRFYKTQFSR